MSDKPPTTHIHSTYSQLIIHYAKGEREGLIEFHLMGEMSKVSKKSPLLWRVK